MDKISCEMCMDLMPLVRDGIASEDSRKAVERHIQTCDTCRAVYKGETVPEANADKPLLKAVKRVQTASLIFLILFVLMGIFLCEMVMQGSSMVFVLVVLGIRGLLRIALRKGEGTGHGFKRALALIAAAGLTVGVIWSGNELFGNPFTKAKAENHIQGYLEGAFADSDYYVEKVLYTWSRSYEGCIRSFSDPELEFFISYRDGEIIYDTYKEHVLDIWE